MSTVNHVALITRPLPRDIFYDIFMKCNL